MKQKIYPEYIDANHYFHITDDVDKSKVQAARHHLTALNPEIDIITHEEPISSGNIADIFRDCNIIIDCMDNLGTRLIINEYCVTRSIAFVHAGVREFYGQVMLINPPATPSMACFF